MKNQAKKTLKPSNEVKPINLSITEGIDLEADTEVVEPIETIRVYQDIPLLNCLIVGASGTGKSTFIKVLGNVDFCNDVKSNVVGSDTSEAEEHKFLIETNQGFKMVRMIDTPGFGDTTGVSTFALELLISEFVKKGYKNLSLVLLAIPYNRRIDADQSATIMSVLKFLGKTLKPVTRILYTFAEGETREDIESYNDQVRVNEHTKRIHKFCKGMFHYTGMSNSTDIKVLSTYRTRQRTSIGNILSEAAALTPVELVGSEYKEASARFVVFEGAGRHAVLLKHLLPDVSDLAKLVFKMKTQLEGIIHDDDSLCDRISNCLTRASSLNLPTIDSQIVEWSKVQSKIEAYMTHGNELEIVSGRAQVLYKELQLLKKEMTDTIFDMEVGSASD